MSGVHTTNNRLAVIRKAAQELAPLEEERKRINQSIREVKLKYIKGDLNMTLKAFNVGYAAYKLDDPADRQQFMADLRETFEALSTGEQVDWVTVAEKREEAAVPASSASQEMEHPTSAEVANYNQGRQAGLNGGSGRDNPWPEGSKAHATWERGWVSGQTEIAESLRPPPARGEGSPESTDAAGSNGAIAPGPAPQEGATPAIKRGRGRPRKNALQSSRSFPENLLN